MSHLLIEVRCEELPYGMIEPALQALARGTVELLDGVDHGLVRTFSTPRRIAVSISSVAPGRPLEENLVTGPPLAAAQRDGEWTKGAMGFARGKGVSVDDLQIVGGPRGKVVGAMVKSGGEQTADLVAAGLEKLVVGLPFRKSMRWGSGTIRWGRPLHQVVAVFDGQRIPASVAGITTSDVVVGHRRSTASPGPVNDTETYLEALRARWVLADRGERQERIRSMLLAKAAELGLEVPLDDELVEEVTDLVEWPSVVTGEFEADLLALPERLLVESMRVHQRTFPTTKDKKLHNVFLVVTNNPEGDARTIGVGNARVLRARFYDARFFFAEDAKKTLDQHGEGLGKMRWVRGLGTMAEKQARLAEQAPRIAVHLKLDATHAGRAGALAKCDLLSQMVGEFDKLQGHIGAIYARNGGEPDEVALAVEEHYLPRYAGDHLPTTAAGTAVAVADRLDTLCGCFGIGLKPKSSADPQGLRRAANGVLAILLAGGHRVALSDLVALGGAAFEKQPVADELVAFITTRLRAILMADGHRTDLVDAVLKAGGDDAVQVRARVQALTTLSAAGEFAPLMTAFKRVLNISKDHTDPSYDRARFVEPAEAVLADAYEAAATSVPGHVDALDVGAALSTMVAMKPAIDAYFDGVMVMAEDPELRAARLGLLCAIATLFRSVADFRLIHTE
ncbi:MAG: glycine--tRNA ligase subunit beta [Proteobacteria bacterium]|nr:glycine--tRNA ligase subunit beta [Pseudomonadota bacterium]MCP4919288.1 glycine--tRNA ligase subunit beta [Pseudomonadota bacterium]